MRRLHDVARVAHLWSVSKAAARLNVSSTTRFAPWALNCGLTLRCRIRGTSPLNRTSAARYPDLDVLAW